MLVCSDFTNLCPRDLSIKKEDAQGKKNDTAQDTRQDEEQCYDLSTTSRPRPDESPTSKQQVMLHEPYSVCCISCIFTDMFSYRGTLLKRVISLCCRTVVTVQMFSVSCQKFMNLSFTSFQNIWRHFLYTEV